MITGGASDSVLGINRTQDASICLLQGGVVVCATQKERLSRTKHAWGSLGDFAMYYSKLQELSSAIDLVVECFSSDPQITLLEEYRSELTKCLRFRGEPRFDLISHHIAHLYSAFFPSGYDHAAVMIIDAMGSPQEHISGNYSTKFNAAPVVEVASFYRASRSQIDVIAKQFWSVCDQVPRGLGCFYHLLTQAIFPGGGNDGKTMGLASYGDPNKLKLPPLRIEGFETFIPFAWLDAFRDTTRFGHFSRGTGTFEDCSNLAAAGQRTFEDAVLALARSLREQTGEGALCFAGGTALNCLSNSRLRRESGFSEVFIPPAPHDGGTALGCAVYGSIEVLGRTPAFNWQSDFLGPTLDLRPYIQALTSARTDLAVHEPSDLPEHVARLLASGQVIALYQGRSEFGPRALGHRSILGDPRRASVREWINEQIKGREMFRPLAPMVLREAAHLYFNNPWISPHMLYTFQATNRAKEAIPAVLHIDGTARVQTVGEDDDAFVYMLLKRFQALTSIGVLLNTSFNTAKIPMVETPADAISCFEEMPIRTLVVPPLIITKKSN